VYRASFDHFVGAGEQRRRPIEAERSNSTNRSNHPYQARTVEALGKIKNRHGNYGTPSRLVPSQFPMEVLLLLPTNDQ